VETLQTEHFRLALVPEWRDYFARTVALIHEPYWHTLPISELSEQWIWRAVESGKELLRIDVLPPGHLVLNIGIRVSIVSPELCRCALALRLDSKAQDEAVRALYEETICLLQYRRQAMLLDSRNQLTIERLAKEYDRW
jgi:hypothetical protein